MKFSQVVWKPISDSNSAEMPYIFVHLTWETERDIAFPYIERVDVEKLLISK